jgi:hypothetical protein
MWGKEDTERGDCAFIAVFSPIFKKRGGSARAYRSKFSGFISAFRIAAI